MSFDRWYSSHFTQDIEWNDAWAYSKQHLEEAYNAGRKAGMEEAARLADDAPEIAEGIRDAIK